MKNMVMSRNKNQSQQENDHPQQKNDHTYTETYTEID